MLNTDGPEQDQSRLPKNLSFESGKGLSYHQTYYYPKLIWSKVRNNRVEMDQTPSDDAVQQFLLGSGEKTKIDCPGGIQSGVMQFASASAADEAASGLSGGQGPRTQRISSNMSESESTDTNYSEDYTRMTDIGEGSDIETRSSAAHDNSANTSGDELFDEAGGLCTYDQDEREVSPQMQENFKGINIDGVKVQHATKINVPAALDLNMNDSVAGLPDPPPSPEADLDPEDDKTSSSLFEGHNLPSDYLSYEGGSFEDREFDFLKAEPIKRSTSLKTNKTPPGTPSRKKVVRFADALGLDLESVRHILNLEAPPKIPATALKDLKVNMKPF